MASAPEHAFRTVEQALDAWTSAVDAVANEHVFEAFETGTDGVVVDAVEDLTAELLGCPGHARIPAVYLYAVLDEHERKAASW